MIDFNTLKKNLKKNAGEYPKLKIALLGDSATQFLATAIRGMGVEHRLNIDLYEADYNQIERQILDQTSEFHEFKADYVILFHSTHKLLSKYNSTSVDTQNALAESRIDFLRFVCESVHSRIIYLNYPEIEDGIFGSYANKVERSFTFQVRKLNYELMLLSQQYPNLFVCDIAALQHKLGRDVFYSPSVYVSTEMVLSLDAIPYVSSRILDIVCAAEGKFKKCLILDLDNTLWGGVIGDDGIENIQLGHGLGIGKVFTEFQEWIKKLKERGIILAVCSKNNEDVAKEPFIKHPDMVLKLEDIAVFMANWDNKVDNIRKIQSILNIGFDSMVFLDDNPFERNMVAEHIPGIVVPELPDDPGLYLEYLYSLNLFETISYNHTDKDRTKQYQQEATRVRFQEHFTDEAGFLQNLEMKSEVRAFTAFNTPRVAQLSQRSNQFNLRTIRYTEADIEQLTRDPKFVTFSFTLSDKFGDNGLICCIIMEKQAQKALFINTWFMSCRVLKRGMEDFTLNTLVEYARENGFQQIIGEYLPTPKNKMVEKHFENLGFKPLSAFPNQYVLDVANYTSKTCYITQQ